MTVCGINSKSVSVIIGIDNVPTLSLNIVIKSIIIRNSSITIDSLTS